MLRHLFKLIWRRKTRHLLLSLELTLAFLVTFPVLAFATRGWELFHLPLGFAFDSVWAVQIQPADGELGKDPALLRRLLTELQTLPAVAHAAAVSYAPYTNSSNSAEFSPPDGSRKGRSLVLTVSDDFFATLGVTITEGRAFTEADAGTADTPVVINREMARTLFPGGNPVGQRFVRAERAKDDKTRFVVTGVFEAYRDAGEFMSATPMTLMRFSAQPGAEVPDQLVLQLRPGTPRVFEAELLAKLKAMRGAWSYQITPLADLRQEKLRVVGTMLAVVAVPACFLLVMVAFGLFGVLWQSTTLRTHEIGLRRAVGAQAGQIYRQIIAEQLLLSTLAMGLALVLLVQLPLAGLWSSDLSWAVFGKATLFSALLIYAISVLCALYPAWVASRLAPAMALHHE